MKKLTKLNLNDLKVESFITSLIGKGSQTVKGGSSGACTVAVATGAAVSAFVGTLALEYWYEIKPKYIDKKAL